MRFNLPCNTKECHYCCSQTGMKVVRLCTLFSIQQISPSVLSWRKCGISVSSIATKAVQVNGFMSLKQHGISFVQVTATLINLALEDS